MSSKNIYYFFVIVPLKSGGLGIIVGVLTYIFSRGSYRFVFSPYKREQGMALRILIDRFTLLDLVHDRWFDLEAFRFDREHQEIRLSLGESRKGPYDEKILKITNVLEVAIDDKAQIGIYDLADVQITASSIQLESAMPLVIRLTIGDRCEISLVQNPANEGKQ